MDPVTAAAVEGASGEGVALSVSAIKWAARKVRLLGTVDPTWLALENRNGPDVQLAVPDITDLRAFLASARVRPVLALLATTMLSEPEGGPPLDVIEEALRNEAQRWNVDHPNGWYKGFPSIWTALLSLLELGLPNVGSEDPFTQELDDISDFAYTGLRPSRDYLDRLVSLASDIEALVRASAAADEVASAVRNGSLPAIISHSDVDEHADFARLYVPRVLHDRQNGEEQAARDVVSAGQCFRIVLLGNPGAGKSTFVRHLSWELAQGLPSQLTQPAIIVQCREYAARSWASPLHEHIASQARAEFGLQADEQAVLDGLTLGKYVVIFDGLDEITDINSRSEFVQRLQRFASNHPLTSILVTSREVGYPRAAFNPIMFDHLSLREFTEEQIRTYVENWFSLRKRVELIEPFMAESGSVNDLRSNPLLLSLLCILYRARGAIPRRRRDIYGKCADLLFNTWDSHRQIEQPEEMPAYGQRLMQEIARWVYSSTTAQNGLEQRVIEKVISTYLVSVGVTEDQARQRSHEFLEFCAGRAWLIGSFGVNDYGDKIFNFTHRTFYEYFAAEAMSRLAKSSESVAEQVMDAYLADATSVLPELLVQAYDERADGGGAEVFRHITSRSADAALILRLMSGSLLPRATRKQGFEKVLDQWRSSPENFDKLGFDALFSLEPNAMHQFRESFLEVAEPEARNFFARGWGAIVLGGRTHIFPTEVADLAAAVADRLVADGNYRPDDVMLNWLVLRGDLGLDSDEIQRYVAVVDEKPPTVGALWIILMELVTGDSEFEATMVRGIVSVARRGAFGQRMTRALADAVSRRVHRDGPVFHAPLPLKLTVRENKDAYVAVTALALAMFEEGVRPAWLVPRVAGIEGTVEDLESARRVALSREELTLDPAVAIRVATLTKVLPTWSKTWVEGEFGLVRQIEHREDLDRWIFG